MKKKVVEIVQKYNLSGSSSDVAKHDFDDEDAGGASDTELTYDKFNKQLVMKRAQQKGQNYLVMMDGDDRKEFLHDVSSYIGGC